MSEERWCHSGVLGALLLLASAPTISGVAGSVHDLSAEDFSGGEICVVCHTPHNALIVEDGPLWNHELTSTESYTLYGSPFMVSVTEQPRGVSRLCLSCHDGTVALGSFGGSSSGTYMAGEARLGVTLADDHPVSIRWEHQNEVNSLCLNCHSLHPPDFVSELPFFGGYVECATCHDVHDGTGYESLLRIPMQDSELCLHCHGK